MLCVTTLIALNPPYLLSFPFHCCCCRYIRYIYNRIILENATVRAAAVSALANFGAKVGVSWCLTHSLPYACFAQAIPGYPTGAVHGSKSAFAAPLCPPALQVPELCPRVVVLLKRALYDNDDEVGLIF